MTPDQINRLIYWLVIITWILVGITFCTAATWGVLAIIEYIKDKLSERRH